MCKKTKVICDTNVWYTISEGRYSQFSDILSKYQLVLTNLSLVELISTPKIGISDDYFQIVRNAFVAISKYAIFRSDNDVEHIMNQLKIDYTDEHHFDIEEKYKFIIKNFLDSAHNSDLTYNYEEHIGQRIECVQRYCNIINQQIQTWRTERKKNPLAVEDVRDCIIWLMKKSICEYLSHHQIKIKKIPFSTNNVNNVISDTFDLYLTAFSNFIFEKYQQPGSKIQVNDYVDFRNLLYCNEGHTYLTFENGKGINISGILNRYYPQCLIPEIGDLRERNKKISQALTE